MSFDTGEISSNLMPATLSFIHAEIIKSLIPHVISQKLNAKVMKMFTTHNQKDKKVLVYMTWFLLNKSKYDTYIPVYDMNLFSNHYK